ncbi:MAG: carbohydrate ABC transporter permease [Treponema sp.]|nr:carbohydrate ABC transporter permease [Treponema sp.]
MRGTTTIRKKNFIKKIQPGYIYSSFLGRPAYFVLVFLSLVLVLFPLYWLILCAVKIPIDVLANPPVFFPRLITFDNFKSLFNRNNITHISSNSLIVTFVSTFISTFFGSMTAYAISRGVLAKKIRNFCAFWFLLQKMYPAIATAIPVYYVVRYLRMLDTLGALIIMNVSFNLPLVIWIMIGFYENIPRGMEESAEIEGCNLAQTFFLIVVPITQAGMIAAAILSFVGTWNEFLFAVILTIKNSKTLPVVVAGFITDKGLDWGPMSAAAFIIIIPVVIVVWLLQKNFVSGLTMGAMKE